VREIDGGRASWSAAALRWAAVGVPALGAALLVGTAGVGIGLLAVLGTVYLWMVWDPRNRGLHDRLAGVVVVRTERSPQF